MSSLEQQEPPPPPLHAHSLPPPFYFGGSAYSPPPLYYGPPPCPPRPPPPPPDPPHPSQKYVDMGLLRPWCLEDYAHSDGTPPPPPAQRWWEVTFKKPWRMPPPGTPGIQFDDRPAPRLLSRRSVGSDYSNWEGRLKRWKLRRTFRPYPNYSLEDIVAHRVYSIAMYFKAPKDPDDVSMHDITMSGAGVPEQFEYWLDEVQGYFEFMELAHELHSIDCLSPLLHHVLVCPHATACIRAKAAELVTTMVHNNPRSQRLVMELDGLDPLWYNFTSDPDVTSRTKALGAISALIRNNESGITAFRETDDGYVALRDVALSSENVWFQREALNLIQYLLYENSSDCNIVTELGLPRIMMHLLASTDDLEVREAALRCLLILARDEEGGNSGQLVKIDDNKLKQVLQELIKRISAMALEDLVAAREEIQLVDSLWNACYNEPSALGEKGLLVLPDEDVPAPDVASKLFEPSLRAWAAAEAADRNFVIEKDYNIVTDLGLPCIMMHLASSDDAKVREAALKGLLVHIRDEEGGSSGQLVKNDDKLKQVLKERIEGISAMGAMAPEDLGIARREIQLVDSLWNACYNEPSPIELWLLWSEASCR